MARQEDKKKRKNCSLCADKVAEFKRQLRLNDSVLRTMFMEASEKASV